MRAWIVIAGLLGTVAAGAQELIEEDATSQIDRLNKLRGQAQQLIDATRSLENWDEHYEYIIDAMERVFERSGWNSESDIFALEMVREVGSIPPWQVQERFDTAMEIVSDRYLLDEGQEIALQQMALQMNVELFTKHSDRILQYGLEALETRAAGEPFSAEQVARWAKLAEPVFDDARQNMNRYAEQFMEDLDPEQRELLRRDLGAANRRMGDVERMSAGWKKGQWDPRDWGMEDDPIQNQAHGLATENADAESGRDDNATTPPGDTPAAARPARDRRTAPRRTSAPRDDGSHSPANPVAPRETASPGPPKTDDPWARYVRAFIAKYHLNDEQQQRAWLFYRDSKDRDEVFEGRHQRQVESVRDKVAEDLSERERIALTKLDQQRKLERDRLFNRLQRRLERLPTRAQRKAAEPEELKLEPQAKPDKPRAKAKRP